MAQHDTDPATGDASDPVQLSVAAYTAHAAAYAAEHAPKMRERAANFAAWLPTRARVLDAGCGPGRDLARFSAWGHDVIGVELNPTFVAMARVHATALLGDLRELTHLLPHRSFDGIWACASLVHLSPLETAEVLRQFALLLTSGGKLYTAVSATGVSGWADEADARRYYTVWTPAVFRGLVAASGFSVFRSADAHFAEVWAMRERSGG